jgi:lipoate---protein ligase
MTPHAWRWDSRRDTATALHARPMAAVRSVEELWPVRECVVLGSAQRESLIDTELAESLDVEVARRRGGGGAVWLAPGAQLWLEFSIPRSDPLWLDDVGEAFMWLGRLFERTLRELGIDAEVHRGAVKTNAASGLVCFAGLGPGEITVGGSKFVGISQRRTKEGARFQLVAYQRLDHERLVSLLGLGPGLGGELVRFVESRSTDADALGISVGAMRDAVRARIEAE